MDEELAAKAAALANEHQLHGADALDVVRKKISLSDALAQATCQRRGSEINALADAEWPDVPVRWDLDPARFHWSLDGETAASFADAYPEAEAVWVDTHALCSRLVDISRRHESPFASDYRSTTAKLVVHLEAGGQVSPPLLSLVPGGLFIAGGNHRLALALHRGDRAIPILVCRSERAAIEKLVPLRDP